MPSPRSTTSRPATLPAGPRRGVTVKAVAEAVGLSQPAVRQVLNGTGRIAESTRQRVLRVARTMGYRPDAAARAVATRKTRQVGVLVLNNPADTDTFPHAYSTILGMNMALEAAGYVLCLVRIGDLEAGAGGQSRVFRERVLDGVIVTTNLPARLARRIEQLAPVCVWADTHRWTETHCVRRDEPDVGRTVARAAVAAGYRKLLFVTEETDAGGVPDHYSHIDRGRGIAAVCAESGVALGVLRQRWHWTEAFSKTLRRELSPEVAVVATDTFRARLVQHTAALHRLAIGQDFGLVCCDNAGSVSHTWPDLAGMAFDRVELGRRSAAMMLAILDGQGDPPSVLMPNQDAWHAGTTLKSGV